MLWVFSIGLFLLALAVPVEGDAPVLSRGLVRRRLWQAGLALVALAVIAGNYNARAVVGLMLFAMLLTIGIGLLYWLDGGRYNRHRIRMTMGWYFRDASPGGEPLGGHRLMALFAVTVIAALLVVRPVAREVLGLNEPERPGFTTVTTEKGFA